MSRDEDSTPDNLASGDRAVQWNWDREDPVEIVLVAFILILFFALPRQGCAFGSQTDDGIQPSFNVSAIERPR